MDNKMSSAAKYLKEIVIDEDWTGESKVLRDWGKNIFCNLKKIYFKL